MAIPAWTQLGWRLVGDTHPDCLERGNSSYRNACVVQEGQCAIYADEDAIESPIPVNGLVMPVMRSCSRLESLILIAGLTVVISCSNTDLSSGIASFKPPPLPV